MSHALHQLQVDSTVWPGWLIFDGLRRGRRGYPRLPVAAPSTLCGAGRAGIWCVSSGCWGVMTPLNRIAPTASFPAHTPVHSLATLGVTAGDGLFSAAEVQQLLRLALPPLGAGLIEPAELRAKLQIVVEERRNYDPQAAIAVLRHRPPAHAHCTSTRPRLPPLTWPSRLPSGSHVNHNCNARHTCFALCRFC